MFKTEQTDKLDITRFSSGFAKVLNKNQGTLLRGIVIKVVNLGIDTFGNPIFQKGLQNSPWL